MPSRHQRLRTPGERQLPSGERNSHLDDFGAFKAVEDFSVFGGFSCRDDDLNDFILNDARAQHEQLLSVTYSYCLRLDGDYSPPVAFVSLANDSLKLKPEQKENVGLGGIGYQEFPAVKVCRLGVHVEFQRKGIGTQVLNTIKRLFLTENRTGCRFITVDAYNNPETLAFYQANDFDFLWNKDATRHTRAMFYNLMRFKAGLSDPAASLEG